MLPNIISGEIKLENILLMRVFEWLVILVGCKIYGMKELETDESKKSFVGWWSFSEDLYWSHLEERPVFVFWMQFQKLG